MYDVIVIGSGPAGITASIYATRRKLKVLIIAKNQGALKEAKQIDNYYGFPEGITGEELYKNGIKQAKYLEIEIVEDEVVALTKLDENSLLQNENLSNTEKYTHFEIETVNSKYTSKAVILATGTSRLKPAIKGIEEFEGKGISYCAICDAFFFRNKDVAVLGNGDYALHEMEQLKPVTKSVTILTNGMPMVENRNTEGVDVIEKKIREFRGENKIQEIEFEDNSKKEIHGIFVAQGTASSCDLARKIGAEIQENTIKVNENMQTTIPGLFACGDCTGGLLQISKAVYEGAKAGLSVLK